MKTQRNRPARPPIESAGTREKLLETAGQVIAEKGVDRATSKEICARAKANVAAINYHFGSFDRLYEEVLCEAHRRLATLESIRQAAAGAPDARGKIEAVVRMIVGALTGPLSSSWVIRVLSREIASPTKALEALQRREALPKFGLMRQIVAELMNLPVTHPAVARGWLSVMGPCALMLIMDRSSMKRMFPEIGLSPADADALVKHVVTFAVAGLKAVADDVRRS
jgi:AcrR family transcriptional regulator